MQILSVTDNEFRKYGRIVDNIDFTALVEELKRTPIPAGVVYEPAVKELEALPVRLDISAVAYGEMPVQIGYCNGHNSKLNALEYHRDSEINVAATDMILMLGLLTDVEKDHTYDTSKVKAFLVPAGTAVEVYATTLHYAPCGVDGKGFQVAVVLPKVLTIHLHQSMQECTIILLTVRMHFLQLLTSGLLAMKRVDLMIQHL